MVEIGDYNLPLIGTDANFDNKLTDSYFVQCCKRIYAVFPILAMCFSTITQVLQIAKSIASQSSVKNNYNEYVQITSNGYTSYFKCQYGQATSAVVYCPFEKNVSFQVAITLWICYFSIFLVVRLAVLFPYNSHDLRFYIAHDLFNVHIVNRVLICTGYILTIVSIGIGLDAMTLETQWNNTTDTDSLINIIMFTGINILGLRKLTNKCVVTKLTNGQETSASMADFPHPLAVSCAVNESPDSIFKKLLVQRMFLLKSGDVAPADNLLPPDKLDYVVNKLFGV